MSTKYEIYNLRQAVIERLKLGLPTTLEEFDNPAHQRARDDAMDNALELITLAREVNCPEFLPCAFYYCTQLPLTMLIEGDGAHTLSPADLIACVKGREELLSAQRTETHPFMYRVGGDRLDCNSCKQVGGNRGISPVLLSIFREDGAFRPFCLRLDPTEVEWAGMHACKTCARHFPSVVKTARKKVWKSFRRCSAWENGKTSLPRRAR